MTSPLISVIIPVYNGQDYVINCIESIEKQSYSPLEIIVVDDGSTDDTRNILEGYVSVSKSANIKLIGLNDLGVSAARNLGIKSSQGEYVTFVDADDRLLPDTISNLYDALIKNEADVSGCKFTKWSEEAEWVKEINDSTKNPISEINGKCYVSKEYLSSQILNGNSRCWSKLYRRSLFDYVSFMEGLTIGEDMLFLIDLLPHVKKWVEIDYQGYGYFQNSKGAMYRPFNPKYLDQIKCWELAKMHTVASGFCENNSQAEFQITRNLIIGIMLVVGKISDLPRKKRSSYIKEIDLCHSKICENVKYRGAFKLLSIKYKLKTKLFYKHPQIYINAYHFLRK